MEVLLIQSEEVDENLLEEVLGLLGRFPEPLTFTAHPEPLVFDPFHFAPFKGNDPSVRKKRVPVFDDPNNFETPCYSITSERFAEKVKPKHTLSWQEIFSAIENYRMLHQIPAHQHVILLTDHHNSNSWFTVFDPGMKLNYFIQTSLWHEFIDGGRRFPVAYEVMANIIRRMCADTFREYLASAHEMPRGCMNDLCVNKEQIALKLRTADICVDCLEYIRARGVSQTLVLQALQVFESIRKQMMFSQHYLSARKPGRVCVKDDKMNIYLVDLDNTPLNLNPLQKVVYLFFLRHEEGIELVNLDDHRQELLELYRRVSNAESEENMRRSIGLLCDPLDNSLHEKLSKIRKVIKSLMGENLGEHYQIQQNGKKYHIPLDRSLVEWQI